MKKNQTVKFLSLIMAVVLIAVVALTGCGSKEDTSSVDTSVSISTEEKIEDSSKTVIGEGATIFTFVVSDLDGKETSYEVHTDKKTVGDALVENKLVEGTVGEWGLMVESVNGIALDFEKDGMYWAFFIDGEYAQTGVDSTDIVAGTTYSFVPTKA